MLAVGVSSQPLPFDVAAVLGADKNVFVHLAECEIITEHKFCEQNICIQQH